MNNPEGRILRHTREQVQAMFLAERKKFARRFPWCKGARLVIHKRQCSPGSRGAYRDVAWAEQDRLVVNVIERFLDLQTGQILGVLRHELGHLADRSDAPGAEARADALAKAVTGEPICYDEDELQNIYEGKAVRPRHLHQ